MNWYDYQMEERPNFIIYIDFTNYKGVLIFRHRKESKTDHSEKLFYTIQGTDFQFSNIHEVINKIDKEY